MNQKLEDEKCVSEYANRLFKPSDFYDIPYPVTIKCPKIGCGCSDVRITGIRHENASPNDENGATADILDFKGDCSHEWQLEFISEHGEIYVGDSYCGEDIVIHRVEPEEQKSQTEKSNKQNEDALEGLGALFG